ncbi:MAG: cytochrome c biogenesis protein CcsA [Lewinellaceae bacterium]|nr:cytochrome c biogenesis protein CcsA [Saprospiraceae bacterium]MCB9329585.1 cytochrome c biogenesis protein CcsA [Lewinellaceae bacterium]
MWWKALSIVLIIYTILAGMLVPLKSGIQRAEPAFAKAGEEVKFRFYGYNTFFQKATDAPIRVWLYYDDQFALAASDFKALNDTILEASFRFPQQLPERKASTSLNALIDHPVAGASLLPAAVYLSSDSLAQTDTVLANAWTANPVKQLHVQSGFSFPYQNVIYESIRNTYFHVPMWFVLLFLFTASVWYSIQYLRNPEPENDRRAAAFAETGLLFGALGLTTGMIWAKYTWGQPWSNDIKQLMTAVALLIYLAYFILRRSFDEYEKGARLAAVYNIFSFASLIPLLYIVPRMFASLHPGATGNPAFGSQDLDNTMRAVFYPAIIGWTLLGFWIAQLRIRYQRLYDKALGLE